MNVHDNTYSGNAIQAFEVLGEEVTADTTWPNEVPVYIVLGDVTVRHANYSPSVGQQGQTYIATLTIEPGVEVRFSPGTGLFIGRVRNNDWDWIGALVAQGTGGSPIIFTSNAASPAPGDWKGIYFTNYAHDATTVLEHCVVEYGGHTHNANIYLANAKTTSQYNTIRNSSHSGIYVDGTGCNNATINCNNLKDNQYGVYIANNAQPSVHNNNLLSNQQYGVFNTGVTVNADDNWWGDENGPGYNGDDVYGDVAYTPWLTSESGCITAPPTNSPPHTPKNPSPANGAVNVPLTDGAVTLSWLGTDPNAWDILTYDVYWGEAADSLALVADDISASSYQKDGLDTGTTYYWQVTTKDDGGMETAGPVWSFTTQGPPPDLVVTAVTWDPATSIEPGQEVTFTATVENSGAGPAVDAFQVDFRIGGTSIGAEQASPIIYAGESLQLNKTWTATVGEHTIEVVADSAGQVTEDDETNNSLSQSMPPILDTTPPVLVSTNPANGAVLQEVTQIVITLSDQHGTVDDAAVIASISVTDSAAQSVSGTITESNDQFTFTPDTSPMADEVYQVSFTAVDMAANSQGHSFSFTVDSQPPAQPTITGGIILSGVIQPRPAENRSNTTMVTLTGTREANTSVWINNVEQVIIGSVDWSVDLTLSQGANALEIWFVDGAENRGPSEWADILVDSVAPAITSITPADNSFLNAPPATVVIEYQEATSALSLGNSTHTIKDSAQAEVAGDWTTSGGNQLIFTPSSPFVDSVYTVDVQLEDDFSNRGTAAQYQFTVDTAPPLAPVINPVTSPTHNPNQTITGTKEAYASILLGGQEVVGNTAETTWQHSVTLTSGSNQFVFTAKDRAGNESASAVVEIVFDDIPPPAVDTLTVDGEGDGTTVTLDWTGYDESAHGDVDFYRLYAETANFTDVTGLTVRATVNAGTFTHTLGDLTKGTTYWFAVVAVDVMGNALTSATPVSGVPSDTVAPEDVTDLSVECFDDRLVFSWTHSADTDGDLAGYKVYFNNDPQGEAIPATQGTYEKTSLNPATAYPFKVAAYDGDDNESAGATITGITLLDNPANLSVTPQSGYAELTWDGVQPSQYVKHYLVYVSETDFSTVEGMTPRLTSAGTSANVAGLTNNVTYYFAVTTVNQSDGEKKTVTTVSATPVPDSVGPEVIDVRVDGVVFVDGQTISKPCTFTLNASDPAGVSRVEFSFDGILLHTDYTAQYSCYWNIVSVDDGGHTLTIVAYDTLGNSTTLNYTVVVALDLPTAPTISEPASGTVTNQETIPVSGQAEKHTEVLLYNNSAQATDPVAVDALGNFSIPLTLTEGENQIQAAAQNRAGIGPLTAAILVTLDTTIPMSPTNVVAQAEAGGVIRVSWRAPADTAVKGYNLFRAAVSFTSPGEATQVNAGLIITTAFHDLPPEDGTYYYRVTTMSATDNESDLSTEVSAESDSIAPSAVSIEYAPQGNYDPATGRMAPGTVDLTLTVSEPLLSSPFLSITPEAGIPISVDLTKTSQLAYSGFFVISDSTPTGTAYAVFSARDLVANRGTEIEAGGSIQIDTDGPAISHITTQPGGLIQNDENDPVAVVVTVGLDEAMKAGDTPALSYLLSGPGRTAIAIDQVTQVATEPGHAETWQGTFVMPADAGLAEPETFSYTYQGVDDLDNVSDKILCPNLFQVYQGDLPPFSPPEGFTGEALADGKIKLTWNEVEGAVGYQLYRQAPGEAELTPYQQLGTVLEFMDEPSTEGDYIYAIASIRQENEQEAVSAMSAPIEVSSDATSPGALLNLSLELVPQGIKAVWEAPPYTEPVTYSLYRADLAEIISVEGLTPLATGITETTAIDSNPSPTDHSYVVTAVDEAGNESAPSNSFYLNFDLLPVSSITVQQQDTAPPVVSWTHPGGSIAGCDLYVGPEGGEVKLNDALLTALTYTDSGYAGDERRYTIIAVDDYAQESLGRSITLPVVRAAMPEGERIKRGIMNRLQYEVKNDATAAVGPMRLKVLVEGHDHTSQSCTVDAGASRVVPVTIGGYADLPDLAAVTTTIEITPNQSETVEIIRTNDIEVGDGMLVVQILNEEFTRGASGSVWFTLENTGEEEIDVITARNSGNAASDEITFYLLDQDDNVLSSMPFQQALGAGVLTLANGNTVARIPAGSTFTSAAMDIPVPASAPDHVTVELAIANIYFHQGGTDQVTMDGLSTTHEVTLVDTSYYGEVLTITPASSKGDEDIVITGRAVERATGLPMAQVPLELVISANGFDRTYEIITDADGDFSYTFTPLSGESGIYSVRAVHPDLLDRPVHGQFVISRVRINPVSINLSIPTNYEQTINIQVSTSEGTEVNNLSLVYEEADQPGGVFPEGVHVSLGSPVSFLGSGQAAALGFTVWADNTAAETGTLLLKVKSDETGADAWGTIVVNTHFSEAQPVLYFSPDHVETGVAHDDAVTETIVLENKGLADMEDVMVSIISEGGAPAPNWVQLNAEADQGTLVVGETRQISMAFSPTSSVSEGMYTFYLRIESANYPTTDINLYVSVTQSGIGNVLFKVSDIYTGTLDQDSQPVQGLANARITLQNEEVLTVEETQMTDALGEAFFPDLPAGRYKCRITADSHQEHIGRFWIKPGITVTDEVFLKYNLVTVEWEVNEITIEDRYEIVLTTTYETDVPAAVLVLEPASVSLPSMQAGDVYNGEFRLTNYGLIRADNIRFSLPAGDQYFSYEVLAGLPESLESHESMTVPYRVTCLMSPSLEAEGQGSGGGCQTDGGCGTVEYDFECLNHVRTTCETGYCITHTACSESEELPPDYHPGPATVSGWGAIGSSGGGLTHPATELAGAGGSQCYPPLGPSEPDCSENDNNTPTRSSVNTLLREYNRDHVDLSVKVPGGSAEARRFYYDGKWYIGPDRTSMAWPMFGESLSANFVLHDYGSAELGFVTTAIIKDGVVYKLPPENFALVTEYDAYGNITSRQYEYTGPRVYYHKTYTIIPEHDSSGYDWKSKSGWSKHYDEDGRMTDIGLRGRTITTLQYEEGANGNLLSIGDTQGTPAIMYEYNPENLISAAYDNHGRRVEYSYTDGLLASVKDVLGNDSFYEYDTEGRLVKAIDAAGRETFISYDDYGSTASVVDSAGNGHFFEYDYDNNKKEYYARVMTSAGMVKEIWDDADGDTKRVDINGRTTKTIVKDGRNLIITDEKGNVTRKEFDEWDNLTKVIHPDGSTKANEYEHTFNRRIREIDERGVVTEYEYDIAGNMTRKVEAADTDNERVTEYTYDGDGNQLTIKVLADANTVEALTTMTYDANGNLETITDPEGNLTQFTSYDGMGNVLTRIDARGKVWTYEYDDAGRLKKITDPLNNTTDLYYDEVGNKIWEVDAEAKEKTYEYDGDDNLIKSTDNALNETFFEYNTDGKLTKQTDAEGKMIQYEYDSEGRLTKTVDGNGNEIVMEYDDTPGTGCSSCSGGSADQPSRIEYPTFAREFVYDVRGRKTQEKDVLSDTEQYITSLAYDETGNLISKTDKENRTTTYEYDELGRLTKVTDPLGKETEYTYDDRDNLLTLEDGNDSMTTFEYDRNNRLVKETRPMGEETTYQYDGVGNLIQKIDAKNQKTEYQYDDAGRMAEIRYFDPGDPVNPVKVVSFTYDKVGNLKTYDDAVTSGQYGYDDAYRTTSESVNYGAFSLANSYGYYKNGTKKTFTGPDGIVYEYSYDANNQLTGVEIPGKGFITYTSYTWNRPASVTLPGGSTKDYVYDPLMRVESITAKDPAQNVLMNYQYTHDKMDNITSKATEHGNYTYGYDELYRLASVDNPTLDDEGFTYDPVGNRLTAADVTGDWTYNANNELGSYDNVSFVYDDNGNMVQKTEGAEVTNFIYNVEDRLVRVEEGSSMVIAEYYYDPFGRRLWKDVGGTKTYFLYADEGLVGEYDTGGAEIRTYGYKPGSTWTTDPLFIKVGNDYHFYQNDHLGTPQKMIGSNGAVVWSANYSSFGEASVGVSSTVTNNLRFPGQYYDQETGLHYNYHRYYNPSASRYLTTDPLLSKFSYENKMLFLALSWISRPTKLNPYLYCQNNPIGSIDTNGLDSSNGQSQECPIPCQTHWDECVTRCTNFWSIPPIEDPLRITFYLRAVVSFNCMTQCAMNPCYYDDPEFDEPLLER